MRPKKTILLIDADETTQSTMRFLLETKGYRVLSAASHEDAQSTVNPLVIDAIVLRDRTQEGVTVDVSRSLKSFALEAPLLVLSARKSRETTDHFADVFLWELAPLTELMERLRVCCQRKRGPKTERKPVQSVLPQPEVRRIA
jgi:two-component system response regulator CpxR